MKRGLEVLLVASVLFNLGSGLFAPIYALFVEGIGGDAVSAGTAISIFMLATGILIMILGKLEDKFDLRHKEMMVVLGYFVLAFTLLGFTLIKTVQHLYIAQAILGIGVAIIGPSWNAVYTKMLDHGKEASEWSYWDGGGRIALAVSAFVGGLIVEAYGFRILFFIMFAMNLCSALVSLKLLGKGKRYKR